MINIIAIDRILVLLLLIALTVILVARRFAIPYTLGLVVVGLLISLFVFSWFFKTCPRILPHTSFARVHSLYLDSNSRL